MTELLPRDNEYHPYKFTGEQLRRAKSIDLPQGWGLKGVVHSGFVMFDINNYPDGFYREASIGPTQEGEVRAYAATEVSPEDGEYEKDLMFEGSFDEAIERLQAWFDDGCPRDDAES